MYPALQKELKPSSVARRNPPNAHKNNLKRIPLGVASNYRAYDPYPIFVKEGSGSAISAISMATNTSITTFVSARSWPDIAIPRS